MEPLRELFRHHVWATTTLVEHCAMLPPEVLQATVPGTFGTVYATVAHLVAADASYLRRFTGGAPPAAASDGNEPTMGELHSRFAGQVALWETLLDQVDSLDVSIPARGSWPGAPHARNLLLLQALHHGNDHRTQVCTILGARGLEVPDLSGWRYWEVTHAG